MMLLYPLIVDTLGIAISSLGSVQSFMLHSTFSRRRIVAVGAECGSNRIDSSMQESFVECGSRDGSRMQESFMHG